MNTNKSTDPKDSSILSDGRKTNDYKSRYPLRAWHRITIEAVYLASLLILVSLAIVFAVSPIESQISNSYFLLLTYFTGPPNSTVFLYALIGKFGLIGGALFDVKWLIHSVAKGRWNEDRILWRLFTPLTSAITSIFFALIVQSGIISLFDESGFNNFELAAAFGMLVGYFADGVIGVLNNMASALFGTVRDRDNEMR